MADSRFSHSRSKRGNSNESGLSRARSAREALRTRKGEVESAVRDVRSIPDDLKLNLQNDAEYDRRSRTEAYNESVRTQNEWRKMSLVEKRDEEQKLLDAMRDPELIAERAEWLIDGSYGRGHYLNARDVIGKKRMNREAWMMTTLGEVEWRVPRDVVVRLWKKLTPAEQQRLNRALLKVIERRRED